MGGPCAYNPEPLADFADVILVGEGEELNLDFYQAWVKHLQAHDGKMRKKRIAGGIGENSGRVYSPLL